MNQVGVHSMQDGPFHSSRSRPLRAPVDRSATATLSPGSDGICYTYIIQGDDTCESVATAHGMSVADIEKYNANTYAWHGCSGRWYLGNFICLGPGEPPMPVALPQATCGPQVPGTTRPSSMSELPGLNPCPPSECVGAIKNLSHTNEADVTHIVYGNGLLRHWNLLPLAQLHRQLRGRAIWHGSSPNWHHAVQINQETQNMNSHKSRSHDKNPDRQEDHNRGSPSPSPNMESDPLRRLRVCWQLLHHFRHSGRGLRMQQHPERPPQHIFLRRPVVSVLHERTVQFDLVR